MFYTSGVHFDPELHEISYKVYQWFTANCYSLSEGEVEVHYCDLTEDNVKGWCEVDGDGLHLISIHNRLPIFEHIVTLIHELIHVCQTMRGITDDNIREKDAEEREEKWAVEFLDSMTVDKVSTFLPQPV